CAAPFDAAQLVSLWDATTGKESAPIKFVKESVSRIHFLDVRTLAVVTTRWEETSVHLWDVIAGKELRRFTMPYICGVYGNVRAPWEFSADNKTFFIPDRQGTIHLFDVASGKEVKTLVAKKGERFQILALAVSPDGKWMATAERYSVATAAT